VAKLFKTPKEIRHLKTKNPLWLILSIFIRVFVAKLFKTLKEINHHQNQKPTLAYFIHFHSCIRVNPPFKNVKADLSSQNPL
jgi:hypothetical protein